MDKLKVAFVDFWPEIKDENIFLPILNKHFEVEVTTSNPDVVIHSIFGGMKQTPQYKCKKFLFLGENYRAANYGSTYSISFDPHSSTNYRLPLWQFYLLLKPALQFVLFGPRIHHENFDRMCSFVVSNPSNIWRNSFFNYISFLSPSIGMIDSYGRFNTNNQALIKASQGRYWRDAKYEFFLKNKHKFAIVFENSSYPYYCTEKLMDAFLAGSMPIYWGDPKIKEDWNTEAFINANKGTDYAAEMMKKMVNSPKLFEEMYSKPIFTEEQRERHINNINGFENWLIEKIKE